MQVGEIDASAADFGDQHVVVPVKVRDKRHQGTQVRLIGLRDPDSSHLIPEEFRCF